MKEILSGMLSPQGSLLIEWGFGLQSDSKYKILAVRGAAAGAGRRGGEEDKGTELRIALSWPKDMKWTTQKNAYSTPVLKKDSCTDILENMSLNLLYLKWNKLLHKITWQDVSQPSINRWSSADSHKKLREQVTWKLLCFLVFRNPLTKLVKFGVMISALNSHLELGIFGILRGQHFPSLSLDGIATYVINYRTADWPTVLQT